MRNVPSRLIVWFIVTVLLICVLIIGVYGSSPGIFPGFISSGFSTGFRYENADAYATGGEDILLDGVTRLDVNWVSGSIDVLSYDGTQVKVYESASRDLKADEMLRYRVQNGTLSVQFCKSLNGFSLRNMPEKHLTILLPGTVALESIAIENVSGDLCLDGGGLSAGAIGIESVSGHVTIRNWIADMLTIENASGEMDIHGEFNRIIAESVSGGQTYHLPVTPDEIEIETVSGEVVLYLTKDRGFSAGLDSVSGRIVTDFAQTPDRKSATWGDGDASMRFETIANDVALRYEDGLSRISPSMPAQQNLPEKKASPMPTPTAAPQSKSTAPIPSSERSF